MAVAEAFERPAIDHYAVAFGAARLERGQLAQGQQLEFGQAIDGRNITGLAARRPAPREFATLVKRGCVEDHRGHQKADDREQEMAVVEPTPTCAVLRRGTRSKRHLHDDGSRSARRPAAAAIKTRMSASTRLLPDPTAPRKYTSRPVNGTMLRFASVM